MDNDSRQRAERDLERLRKQWKKEERAAKIQRFFGKKPMQYKQIPVPDWDERTKQLSAFRAAYGDFFAKNTYEENSELQAHSTQLFWHNLYLQKQRMRDLGITMSMESQRVQRSKVAKESIMESEHFDGRYMVNEVNEAICSKRTFMKDGREIGAFRDFDSVNFSILSAKQEGDNNIVCPNCGNVTTRENLIDGCDYCGTKFTIEDLENKVSRFEFQPEDAREGLGEKARQARLYFDESAGEMVRKFDPNFSFRSFRANIFNMISAIHFAKSFKQINLFSSVDLSPLMEQYKDIVNIDFIGLRMWDNSALVEAGLREKNNFYVEDGMQHIICTITLVLFVLRDGKVQLRDEILNLELQKSADCLTQNVCGPSLLNCKGCGSSLSLMDGGVCPYCGNELDMKNYDWVITNYDSNLKEFGQSYREYN